jgi:cation diffusion facilitator CzcD-associated flavoprotein CzcO
MPPGARSPMEHVRVAIIGAGFSGVGAAIRLMREGVTDLAILERSDDIGGTWRDNTYPGCACDVQSHLYSYSFAPNPDWTRSFSRQPEIWAYFKRVAGSSGVMRYLRLGHEVLGAGWDAPARRWLVRTSRGDLTASALIMAAGALSDPVLPELTGLERFSGAAFHSARWDHAADLRGRRVAVIGTGASAIQFIPEIQPVVERLYVFQRTAPWVVPRRDRALRQWERALFRRVPAAQRLVRAAIYAGREALVVAFRREALMRRLQWIAMRHLRRSVSDPALRERLTPPFTMGCKRVLPSNAYYPAVSQPNVEVVTGRIARVTEGAVVTEDGSAREVDVIVFATGFRPTDPVLGHAIRGRGGRSLAETWQGSPRAYLGTMVAGFPNLFLLMGPNTALGHSSVLYMVEAQLELVAAAIRRLSDHGLLALEPREEAQSAYVAEVDRHMRGSVWTSGGCSSWYLDHTGRNSTIWPDFTFRFRRMLSRLRPEDFHLEGPEPEIP